MNGGGRRLRGVPAEYRQLITDLLLSPTRGDLTVLAVQSACAIRG